MRIRNTIYSFASCLAPLGLMACLTLPSGSSTDAGDAGPTSDVATVADDGTERGDLGARSDTDDDDDDAASSDAGADSGPTGVQWRAVSVGGDHVCAITTADELYCWGSNEFDQLNTTAPGTDATPRRIDVGAPVEHVAAGGFHTCAETSGGVRCWGSNARGQSDPNSEAAKVRVSDPLAMDTFEIATGTLDASSTHTCMVDASDDVRQVVCWGADGGSVVSSDGSAIGLVQQTNGPSRVGAGNFASALVDIDGAIRAWGEYGSGLINDSNCDPGCSTAETVAMPGAQPFGSPSVGEVHGCALRSVGIEDFVYCWGGNSDRQADNTPDEFVTAPLEYDDLPVRAVSAGYTHTCVIRSGDRRVSCWGSNAEMQLGSDNTSEVNLLIDTPGSFFAVSAGDRVTCGLRNGDDVDGELVCWGSNRAMQLGPNGAEMQRSDAPVVIPPPTTVF